jgi:hypothetical protein
LIVPVLIMTFNVNSSRQPRLFDFTSRQSQVTRQTNTTNKTSSSLRKSKLRLWSIDRYPSDDYRYRYDNDVPPTNYSRLWNTYLPLTHSYWYSAPLTPFTPPYIPRPYSPARIGPTSPTLNLTRRALYTSSTITSFT